MTEEGAEKNSASGADRTNAPRGGGRRCQTSSQRMPSRVPPERSVNRASQYRAQSQTADDGEGDQVRQPAADPDSRAIRTAKDEVIVGMVTRRWEAEAVREGGGRGCRSRSRPWSVQGRTRVPPQCRGIQRGATAARPVRRRPRKRTRVADRRQRGEEASAERLRRANRVMHVKVDREGSPRAAPRSSGEQGHAIATRQAARTPATPIPGGSVDRHRHRHHTGGRGSTAAPREQASGGREPEVGVDDHRPTPGQHRDSATSTIASRRRPRPKRHRLPREQRAPGTAAQVQRDALAGR